MAYISQVSEVEATGPMGSVYGAARKRTGRVANIIRIMSQDGRSCQASMGLYISLMKTENALPAAQREMLATVVSNVNDCYY